MYARPRLAAIAMRFERHRHNRRCVAQCEPSAGSSWGGMIHRAGGTVRARLAAIATRLLRHTPGPPGVGPLPAAAGLDGHVKRAALCVPGSMRSLRACGDTHTGRPTRRPHHRLLHARDVASRC